MRSGMQGIVDDAVKRAVEWAKRERADTLYPILGAVWEAWVTMRSKISMVPGKT